MIIITGSYNRNTGAFRMHGYNATFPRDIVTYIGYTEKEMKKQYRRDYGLEHKHIEWIII